MIDYIDIEGPQSYVLTGKRFILCKGGGGGGKGGVGMVLGLVASIAMPIAFPAMAAEMGGGLVGQMMASAATGAVSATVSGGNPLKGALMGGIGGGIANMAGFGAGAGIEAVGADQATVTAFDNAGTPGFDNYGNVSGDFGAAVNTDLGATLNADGSYSPGAVSATSLDATGSPTSFVPDASNAGGYASMMDPAQTPSASLSQSMSDAGNKVWTSLTNPDNLTKAGLQLGVNALGGAITGNNGMDSYTDQLKRQTQQNQQIFAFNKGQAEKKSAVGDQLQRNAASYDPNYTGDQQAAFSQIGSDNAWDTTEKSLRAQGRDDNYINAEKARAQLGAGLNKASAYDSGWQKGQAAQTNTYTAAGQMYGQVNNPADMSGAYQVYANQQAKNKQAAGGVLEKAFGIDGATDANGTDAAAKKAKAQVER